MQNGRRDNSKLQQIVGFDCKVVSHNKMSIIVAAFGVCPLGERSFHGHDPEGV